MYPTLFQVSLPSAVPRLLLVLALALGLTVFGLSFLIRERGTAFVSLLSACFATALLFGLKSARLSPIQVRVTPFGAALGLSIALGAGLSVRGASRAGLDCEWVIRCLGCALLGGFLGARLGYVWLYSPAIPWRAVFSLETGGLFGYGAYAGALFGAAVASRGQPRQQLRRWLDVQSPLLLPMLGLTRLGCYLEGCDFGRPLGSNAPHFLRALGTYPRWNPTPDGSFSGSPAWLNHVLDFGLSTESTHSLATHPTQLYEVGFAVFVGAGVLHFGRCKGFNGQVFLLVALCYSVGRYFLDILRGDPDRGLITARDAGHWFRLSSWSQVCALVSVLATILLWRQWRNVPVSIGSRTGGK